MNRKERRKRCRVIMKELKKIDKHNHYDVPEDLLKKAHKLNDELVELSGKDYLDHVR